MNKQQLTKLSVEEKALLTSGRGAWHTHAVGDLPEIMMTDGPHGLRKQSDAPKGINDSNVATCFPTSCAVASSWNVQNAAEIARCIAEEAIAEDVSVVLGPGVNIKRSPLCGRNFEYYSEDPLLAGEMASAYVSSMQQQGVGSCLKHFAVNSQETRRMTVDAIVDQRALREIYLAAFEKVVKKSSPWAIMASYNKVNGQSATENASLYEILRGEWHFDGVVMSDWGASYNTAKALQAGMDLEMPEDLSGFHRVTVVEGVAKGVLAPEQLDRACLNVSNLVEKCLNSPKAANAWTRQQHHDVCRKIVADSAVLLKNDGILPLSRQEDFCVVGQMAVKPRFQGAGSSHINAVCKNFLQVLKEEGIEAEFADGYLVEKDSVSQEMENAALEMAKRHKVVLFFGGLTDIFEGEGYDRTSLEIPSNQQSLLVKLHNAGCKTVFVGFGGAPFVAPWLNCTNAFLNMYLGGEAVMEGAFDLIFGEVSPSGRLAETFPLKLQDTPCYNYFANNRFFDEHRESIFVGYRYYNTFDIPVLFPFGYGLSYSQFRYSALRVKKQKEGFELSVTVKNVGNFPACEVVQVYVDNCQGGFMRASRELKAFEKVFLRVGESITVTFRLDKDAFSMFIPEQGFVVVNGDYTLSVCKNVNETLLSGKVRVNFGKDVKGDDVENYPSYFQKPQGVFNVTDREFNKLTGTTPQPPKQLERGEFTLLNTLEDIAPKVWLVRQMLKHIRKMAIKQSPTKTFQDPVAQMTYFGSLQTPLFSIMSVGGIDSKYVLFLLDHANKKHGKAIKDLLGCNKSIPEKSEQE